MLITLTLRDCSRIDEFYSDYRNRRIKVASGVGIVLNEISGKSTDEMQKLIETHRKNAIPPTP
jgi:hypothetical protein